MKLKNLIASFVFTAFGLLAHAQADTSFQVRFDDSCFLSNFYKSKKLKVQIPEWYFNSGHSAFILQEDIEAKIELRLKTEKGWTEWQILDHFHEGGLEDRTSFGPFFHKEKFDSIQYRSDQKLETEMTFRIFFIPPPPSPIQKKKHKLSSDSCGCPEPVICDRNCWCPSGNCPEDPTPALHNVTHFIVHHTAGTESDDPSVVQAIWDFHVNTNGWDDIGYNFLIGSGGTIFTGRADTLQGAHFSCMNTGTLGISLLGDFTMHPPSDSSLQSLIDLLISKSCKFNIDPIGRSWHANSLLELRHISGHLDGNISTTGCPKGTACPGDFLYPLLDSIAQETKSHPCLTGVGLNESKTLQIDVFPNPAKELFMVYKKGFSGNIYIQNQLGQIVHSSTFKERIEISSETWPTGVYLLHLFGKHDHQTFKVLISK